MQRGSWSAGTPGASQLCNEPGTPRADNARTPRPRAPPSVPGSHLRSLTPRPAAPSDQAPHPIRLAWGAQRRRTARLAPGLSPRS